MYNTCIWGITKGRGSGIGFAVGEYLGLRNFPVFGVVRDPEKEVPAKCRGKVVLPNRAEYQNFLSDNNIQAVVSCVGEGWAEHFLTIEEDKIERSIDANLKTNIKMLQWSIPHLLEVPKGKVVVLGTIAAVHPKEGSAVYSGTKAGMRAVIESLRNELLPSRLPLSMLHFNSVGRNGLEIRDICEAVEYQLHCTVGSELTLC